jgi:phosphonate transport system substrate-binding protein
MFDSCRVSFAARRVRAFVVLGYAATALLTACGTGPQSVPAPPLRGFTLAVQAAKPDETRAAWAPLVQDMGRHLQAPVALLVASQTDVVQALKDGKGDVAWLSSSAAVDAVASAGASVFALYVNVNGTRGYTGVVLARADSGITTLEQALQPGRYRYASGAKTSTSGYLLPQHFLFNPRGTTAEAVFKTVTYGSHFDNLAALWAGQVDVAVNNSTDTAVFQTQRQPAAQGQLRVLWESPLVPNDVLMVRQGTPAATQAALADFFLRRYGQTAAEQALLRAASGIQNFVPASNRLLEPVAGFKFASDRAALAARTGLTDAEKAAALLDLQGRERAFAASLPLPR